MKTKYRINIKNEAGFSLLEVLITMIILAVGLLSIAALQFRGLQYSNDAHMRSSFNIFAYDIMDRMRNNRGSLASYTGNYTVPTTWSGGTCNESLSPPTAANDLVCWHQQLFDNIPPGSTANITTAASATYTQYIVTLSWESRDGVTNSIRHMLADPI